MTRAEYRALREQFERDLALRKYYLRLHYEREYRQFVFMGSHAQRERVLAQWKASDAQRIDQQLADVRRELELQYFGPGDMEEESSSAAVELKPVPQTPTAKPGFGERLRKAYLTLFW